MKHDPSDRVSRRDFVRTAVVTGGAAALSACLDREGEDGDLDLPTGPETLDDLPERQHAWNASLATDEHGNDRAPRHHALLSFDYGDGIPGDEDRQVVESALRSIERAYPRSHDGLLFTVGYSPAYFDRFGGVLPDGVDLPTPTSLAPFESPEFDDPDVIVHLASDYGSVVLGAEQALLGRQDDLNGVEVTGIDRVLERVDRRTGFVGAGLPADNQDVTGIPDSEPVPEDSPLYMGFKSGFQRNQASEDSITIDRGPFAGGTTQHVSKLRLNLDQWYEQDDRFHRVATMFCPVHAEEGLVDGPGQNLGTTDEIAERGCPARVHDHAREKGVVGHSQKSARARDEDGNPLILRRDFDSTDGGRATLHFVALQETISDFVDTREAMNGTDLTGGAVGQRTNNGILQYFRVERRGNFLIPPRRYRSLPPIDPG